MSTTLETIPLEGVIWEGTPPCDCILWNGNTCGRPSVTRILTHCGSCQDTIHGWVCASCWRCLLPYMASQDFTCRYCGGRRTVKEI